MSQFVPDTQWFRTRQGLGVLAGSPLTQFTVTQAGAVVLNALESGSDLPRGHEPLTSRLLATGAIHPISTHRADPTDVTVVIPTFCNSTQKVERLQKLCTSLHGLSVIVVDDASPVAFSLNDAQVIRHDENTGPGAARNTGVTQVVTPYVVFIDDDVTIDRDTVLLLTGILVDGFAHCVAPRIASATGNNSIDDYEQHSSSLDLGKDPAVVRPTSRVSYVPSAALACEVQAFRELGGFDESLRVGEDVDFIWRVSECGRVCRYAPTLTCTHLSRQSIAQLARQRFSYGSSAAALDVRHPMAATPLRTHLLLLLAPLLFLSGYFLWSLPAVVATYLWFSLSLRSTKLTVRDRLRVVSIGLSSTTRLFMTAVTRTWWPLCALLSVFFSPIALLFALCLTLPSIADLATKRPRHPFSFLLLRVIDNFSYGLGVWTGAFTARSFRCLLPAITVRSGRLRSKG